MATIERDISGIIWSVTEDGSVSHGEFPVLDPRGEVIGMVQRSAFALRIAFALRDEWQTLRDNKDTEMPPSASLPPGCTWEREYQGGPWCIARRFDNCSCSVLRMRIHGEDLVTALAIVSAADEMAARKKG